MRGLHWGKLHAQLVKACNIISDGCVLPEHSPIVLKATVFVWGNEEVAECFADFFPGKCRGLISVMVSKPNSGLIREDGIKDMIDVGGVRIGQGEVTVDRSNPGL